MPLSDAILGIADDMEEVAKEGDNLMLKTFAKQLRRAVQASVEPEKPKYVKPNWEEEARLEFKNSKKIFAQKASLEESFLGEQVEIVDGPLGSDDGVPNLWPIPPGGTPGSKAVLDNQFVYKLGEDRKLHFLPDETKVLRESVANSQPKIILGEA
ncbi:hypothetical protein C4577_03500 [Candidatus Parcubacteria bacterium]|nr:MAG: hypothetical protein C4577_03500 [Candidatus Parcubacteria bacterium]